MSEISDALVARMVELTRSAAEQFDWGKFGDLETFMKEARAIVAELPALVDPDWEEAAKLCMSDSFTVHRWTGLPVKKGDRYAHHTIYDAIKRGRELERAK